MFGKFVYSPGAAGSISLGYYAESKEKVSSKTV
jgi:hypothetical protein